MKDPERVRLEERAAWEKWGPYVAERGWGTVREDYSANGDAWNYFPHGQAHLRAYRRAEDGLAAITDRYHTLLFAPAFWNGKDPLLKERLFGLNSWEGNHGEDVKECYYHLDATPTHSYLKYLYKYPQREFPYQKLIEENRKRGVEDREYELVDTGVFDEDRYFDLFIEYGKKDPEDLSIRIEAKNRGPDPAPLHILAQLWFWNQWSWEAERKSEPVIFLEKRDTPEFYLVADDHNLSFPAYFLTDPHLGKRYLYASPGGVPLFTQNESNKTALWGEPNETPYVRDAFHRFVIRKEKDAVNPALRGTKAAIHYQFPSIAPGDSAVVLLRLSKEEKKAPLRDVEEVICKRKKEADLFYRNLHPPFATEEERAIQRQALSGMIWNKQLYFFDVGTWLNGDNSKAPPPPSRKTIRNSRWRHLNSTFVFSMPDKWEFPWFAAWDLAFHSLVFSLIDLEFAKNQLWILLFDRLQHPNGAIPAYEWEFSDVNPPLQAWAALKLFSYEKEKYGREDFPFLEKCFHKLLLNFSWWINKVDHLGNNVFEGGFLGMDNIGFIDRSCHLPSGHHLDQADGAGWVSLLCLNLMRMALTLARKNPVYEELGIKFFQHFLYVANAMRKGAWRNYDMWDEKDGFFYSYIRCSDGQVTKVPVRSLVGLVPFFACDVWEEKELKAFPKFYSVYEWMVRKRPHLADTCLQTVSSGSSSKLFLGLLNAKELKRLLTHVWDPEEFRSEFGLRSLSKFHEHHPAQMHESYVAYEPGEAREKIKGGNSNWRGPIWFPLNYLLIDTLIRLDGAFGDTLRIRVREEPEVTLKEMGKGFAERLLRLFKKDVRGDRPFLGDAKKFQQDPYFKEHFLFHEHFHADSGRGLGASQQTGWTGLIANLIEELRKHNSH